MPSTSTGAASDPSGVSWGLLSSHADVSNSYFGGTYSKTTGFITRETHTLLHPKHLALFLLTSGHHHKSEEVGGTGAF